jgi:AraC-like DNA-binding protein
MNNLPNNMAVGLHDVMPQKELLHDFSVTILTNEQLVSFAFRNQDAPKAISLVLQNHTSFIVNANQDFIQKQGKEIFEILKSQENVINHLITDLVKSNLIFAISYLPLFSSRSSASLTTKTDRENNFERVCQKYIMSNFGQALPNIEYIAQELHLSTTTFKNRFLKKYGKPVYVFYNEKRMEHAAKLLKKGYKCNEVSQRVGYGEKSAIKFNKMFQKHFGITPKKYQMEHFQKSK